MLSGQEQLVARQLGAALLEGTQHHPLHSGHLRHRRKEERTAPAVHFVGALPGARCEGVRQESRAGADLRALCLAHSVGSHLRHLRLADGRDHAMRVKKQCHYETTLTMRCMTLKRK